MKNLVLAAAVVIVSASLLNFPAEQEVIEGCYSKSEKITSFVSEESELKSSYLNIAKASGDFLVEGIIWGANYHVCSIASPIEGSESPLRMSISQGKLVYRYDEPAYNIKCELEIAFQDDKLTFHDSNGHCSQYVFYCGVHSSLDSVELSKISASSPDTNNDFNMGQP